MIRRISIQGYKSLANCDLDLGPITVIFGPNGAGKSNLLDLIGLLSRLAQKETIREAFKDHRGLPLEAFHSPGGFGKAQLDRLQAFERLSFRVVCDLELSPKIVEGVNHTLAERERLVGSATYTRVSERLLRYSVEVAIHPSTGEMFIADESLEALRSDLDPKTSRKPFFERENGTPGAERFVARIERQSHPRYFEADRSRTLLSELSDPVYHPHVVAAAREIGSWRVYYVEPGDMRREVGVQSADEPGRGGELLAPFYYTLQTKHPASLKGVVRNLRQFLPSLVGIEVRVRDAMLELISIHEGNAEFPARLLSEGTLRLLCIMGIAVSPNPPSVVVYEEPENGINAGRLELLTQILKTAVTTRQESSQFIITTHSPLVCSLLPEHLILCKGSPPRGTEFSPFPWNPDSLYFESEVVQALDDASTASF